jgi:hypothetical protein
MEFIGHGPPLYSILVLLKTLSHKTFNHQTYCPSGSVFAAGIRPDVFQHPPELA